MAQINPLNDVDCDCLDKALQKLAELKALIADCKDCGLDFGPALEEAEMQEQMARKLKAKFFPHRA